MKKYVMMLCLALLASASAHDILTLRFIGEQKVRSGATFEGTEIGGISGLDYDPSTGNYWAISDDRSQYNPARFYELALMIDDSSFSNGELLQVIPLQTPEGNIFARGMVDPESIRVRGDRLFWSSEGENSAQRSLAPFVWEMNKDGSALRAFEVPHRYLPIPNVPIGVRNNLAFESLTLSPDGNTLYTATEGPLLQDGEVSSLVAGSLVRFTEYEVSSGEPQAEYVYVVDPVPFAAEPLDAFTTVGVTEILSYDVDRFLVLERAYAQGVGNGARLYMVDKRGASNVLEVPSLRALRNLVPMRKYLVLDLQDLGIPLDNLEAMTFGPALPNGNRVLVLASDNNFSENQVTQFLAFELQVR